MKTKELIDEKLCLLESEMKELNKMKVRLEKAQDFEGFRYINSRLARVESKVGMLRWVLK